jgi:hypothetical protein
MVNSRDLSEVAIFPIYLPFVAAFAGPFALLTGLIGMTVLTRTRPKEPTPQRYVGESVASGALIGVCYPFIWAFWGDLAGAVGWLFDWLLLVLGLVSGRSVVYSSVISPSVECFARRVSTEILVSC